ncbi:MAG: IclR family transcriptional regulator [Lautropia sp.]
MGLQTLDRAVGLLRLLGSKGEAGLRLVDVQSAMQLTKPTAHRLLTELARHGLVAHDPVRHRYRLGQELAVLGWSVVDRQQDLRTTAMHSAAMLAEETGDTVFVVARSGVETVCIDRHTGAYPIKALTIDVGTRRPLGVGAGGLAILATLPDVQASAILEVVGERLPEHCRATLAQVRQVVAEARSRGFAISNGFVNPDVRAVGVSIRDFRDDPIAAIGVAAIHARLPHRRIASIARSLSRERNRIEARLRSGEHRATAARSSRQR